MITLGLETSCDETSVALLQTRGSAGRRTELEYRVLSHLTHSQIAIHSKYGGVFPMMAKREHAKRLVPLLEKAIQESGIGAVPFEPSEKDLENMKKICDEHDEELFRAIVDSSLVMKKPVIDRIAVTHGPGLEPALWVGVNFASALGALWNIPIKGVNHMEGHIAASLLQKTEAHHAFERLVECPFPAIAVLLSGGHTEIVLVKKIGDYKILGATRDDAVGEAFDKVARMLGLPYPGGPEISRLAEEARKGYGRSATADTSVEETPQPTGEDRGIFQQTNQQIRPSGANVRAPRQNVSAGAFNISLPRPMIDSPSLNMSFSGLKTAVLYELRKHPEITDDLKKGVAREFEDAVTETIITKLEKAFDENNANALVAGGGVLANKYIQTACAELARKRGIPFFPPAPGLSGDNALMIAMAGAIGGKTASPVPLVARGNLSLE